MTTVEIPKKSDNTINKEVYIKWLNNQRFMRSNKLYQLLFFILGFLFYYFIGLFFSQSLSYSIGYYFYVGSAMALFVLWPLSYRVKRVFFGEYSRCPYCFKRLLCFSIGVNSFLDNRFLISSNCCLHCEKIVLKDSRKKLSEKDKLPLTSSKTRFGYWLLSSCLIVQWYIIFVIVVSFIFRFDSSKMSNAQQIAWFAFGVITLLYAFLNKKYWRYLFCPACNNCDLLRSSSFLAVMTKSCHHCGVEIIKKETNV